MTKRVWTRWAHQVLQQGGQLLGEGGELDEGRPQVGVVPADEVAAKFVQSLGVVFFILNVVWVGKKEEVNYRSVYLNWTLSAVINTYHR